MIRKESLEEKLKKKNIDPLCWSAWGLGAGAAAQAFYEHYTKGGGVLYASIMSASMLAVGTIHYNAMKYKEPEQVNKKDNLFYLTASLLGVIGGSLAIPKEHFAFIGSGLAIGGILSLYNYYKQQKEASKPK